MTDTNDAHQPRRNWTRWLLIGSLALNMTIVGVIAGFAIRGPGIKPPNAPSLPGAISLLRAVPDSHRGQLRDAFREQRETLKSNRAKISELRTEFLVILENDPLDVAQLEGLLAQHAEIEADISERGRTLLLQTVSDMDLDARQELVEKARKMGIHGDRRPRKK